MIPENIARIPTCSVTWDCETDIVQPGLNIPPLVCAAVATAEQPNGILFDKVQARAAFDRFIRIPQLIWCGLNICYDMLVMGQDAADRGVDLMPFIFAAYGGKDITQGRVFDESLGERLHAVAEGLLGIDPTTHKLLLADRKGYSLSVCHKLITGKTDAKVNDKWRLKYHLLHDVPIEQWEPEAQQYPRDDVRNTRGDIMAQVGAEPINQWKHQLMNDRCISCGLGLAEIALVGPTTCMVKRPRRNLHDMSRQAYAEFCMRLNAAHGFRVDPVAVAALQQKQATHNPDGSLTLRGEEQRDLMAAGVLKPDGKANGSEIKKRIAIAFGSDPLSQCTTCNGTGKVLSVKSKRPIQCEACDATGMEIGSDVPRTKGDGITAKRDTCVESGDEDLITYGHYSEGAKIIGTYIPWLEEGIRNGKVIPLTLYPNVLLETGRTSYMGVVQLLPRKGGVRECIVPSEGNTFYSVDFGSVELVTHAQSCLWLCGFSNLATALNKKLKPHNALAAQMMGISYEEFNRRIDAGDQLCIDIRQAAKPGNFGFPGGMGAVKLVLQQREQGPDTTTKSGKKYKGLRFCILMDGRDSCGDVKVTEYKKRKIAPTCLACIHCAERLRKVWIETWPENTPYFDRVNAAAKRGEVVQHVSKRIRGETKGPSATSTYCSFANGWFQGLAAEAAKEAMCLVTYEQFCEPSSVLYGSRGILFAHDELIGESPDYIAPEAADRVSTIMTEVLAKYCPDVRGTAEPTLMKRWYKGAACVRNDNGRLQVWEPRKAA